MIDKKIRQSTICLLNGTPLTQSGLYYYDKISTNNVKKLVTDATSIKSYIGHIGLAQKINETLGLDIECSNRKFYFDPGETVIIARIPSKTRGRKLEMKYWYIKDKPLKFYQLKLINPSTDFEMPNETLKQGLKSSMKHRALPIDLAKKMREALDLYIKNRA